MPVESDIFKRLGEFAPDTTGETDDLFRRLGEFAPGDTPARREQTNLVTRLGEFAPDVKPAPKPLMERLGEFAPEAPVATPQRDALREVIGPKRRSEPQQQEVVMSPEQEAKSPPLAAYPAAGAASGFMQTWALLPAKIFRLAAEAMHRQVALKPTEDLGPTGAVLRPDKRSWLRKALGKVFHREAQMAAAIEQGAEDYIKEMREQFPRPSVTEEGPKALLDPRLALSGVGEAGQQIAGAALTAGATGLPVGAVAGFQEAVPYYDDLQKQKVPFAGARAVAYGTLVGAMEARFGVGKISKLWKDAAKQAVRKTPAKTLIGSVLKRGMQVAPSEAIQEWTEGPIGGVLEWLGRTDDGRELWEKTKEAAIREADVLPGSFLASLIFGGVGGAQEFAQAKEAQAAPTEALADPVDRVRSQIAAGPETTATLPSVLDLETRLVDDLAPIREYAKELGGEGTADVDNPYKLARIYPGWSGKAESFLQHGTLDADWNITGEPLNAILRPVEERGKLDDFRTYLISERATELADRGVDTGIARDDAVASSEQLLKDNPEFQEEAQRLYAYQDSLLTYLRDLGVFSEDVYTAIKDANQLYIPFYRAMEQQQGTGRKRFVDLFNPVRRIKGSKRQIVDPLESVVKNTYAFLRLAEKHRIGRAVGDLASTTKPSDWITPIPQHQVAKRYGLQQVETALDKIGLDLQGEAAQEFVTLFSPKAFSPEENVISVLEGKQRRYYQVRPDLYKALQNLNEVESGWLIKILSQPARVLRAGATLTPEFGARNPMRDQLAAFIYSEYGYVPGVDFARGLFNALGKTDAYWNWKISGGEFASFVGLDRTSIQQTLKELVKGGWIKHVPNIVRNPIEAMRVLSEFGESATRLGESIRGMKVEQQRGATRQEALVRSGLASREVSQDFAKQGSYVRAVNRIVAFFGARVGGYTKMYKAFKKNPVRTTAKALASITLPSLLLLLHNRRDPRWDTIPQWQKDLFWIVMTGGISQEEWDQMNEDQKAEYMAAHKIWRIPKPFELGVIFGSIPERIVEWMADRDPDHAAQILRSLAQVDVPNPLAVQALLPIWQNARNVKWTGAPIVPKGLERLEPKFQYTHFTSETAKQLGKMANVSPAKLDNLIYGYTGGLGRYGIDLSDKMLRALNIGEPEQHTLGEKIAASQPEDWPIVKAFTVRYPVASTDKLQEFYEDLRKARMYDATYRMLLNRDDDASFAESERYLNKHAALIDRRPELEDLAAELSDMREEMQDIDRDPTLSLEERKEQVKNISARMVLLIKERSKE